MTGINASAVAFYRRALDVRGETVTVMRNRGVSPNIITVSASVKAIVDSVVGDASAPSRTGYGSSDIGAITQNDRSLIILALDLQAQNFPLPVLKGDRILLTSNGDLLDVSIVNMSKRAVAGAIEITAAGVE